MIVDVPSPIDLRLMEDARPWADTALARRPVRPEFFDAFASRIGAGPKRVLELGSGPGILADHLLRVLPELRYTALDFSPAMHLLAQERLGERARGVTFVERSFREPSWVEGLGPFDVVVTHQAVHELRHKGYAAALHAQVRPLLAAGGCYLVCDHYLGGDGLSNDQLYMSVEDQADALRRGGFEGVEPVLVKGGLALHQAQ
ncbi:MAG: class I SAM-dependent methyltransferase [Betaproteobacteria bacterium]